MLACFYSFFLYLPKICVKTVQELVRQCLSGSALAYYVDNTGSIPARLNRSATGHCLESTVPIRSSSLNGMTNLTFSQKHTKNENSCCQSYASLNSGRNKILVRIYLY